MEINTIITGKHNVNFLLDGPFEFLYLVEIILRSLITILLSLCAWKCRRSGRKSAATSDNESEASGMSWASAGVLQGGAHSSHRRRNESGSESESRSSRRADRRGRRKR